MCQGRMEDADGDTAVDMESMLSREGRARHMAGLRKVVTAFAGVPGIIGLHGGLPPASAFPITGVTLTLQNGQKVDLDDPIKVRVLSSTRHAYVAEPAAQPYASCQQVCNAIKATSSWQHGIPTTLWPCCPFLHIKPLEGGTRSCCPRPCEMLSPSMTLHPSAASTDTQVTA